MTDSERTIHLSATESNGLFRHVEHRLFYHTEYQIESRSAHLPKITHVQTAVDVQHTEGKT